MNQTELVQTTEEPHQDHQLKLWLANTFVSIFSPAGQFTSMPGQVIQTEFGIPEDFTFDRVGHHGLLQHS